MLSEDDVYDMLDEKYQQGYDDGYAKGLSDAASQERSPHGYGWYDEANREELVVCPAEIPDGLPVYIKGTDTLVAHFSHRGDHDEPIEHFHFDSRIRAPRRGEPGHLENRRWVVVEMMLVRRDGELRWSISEEQDAGGTALEDVLSDECFRKVEV